MDREYQNSSFMKNLIIILSALWKIAVWWKNKDDVKQAYRKVLIKEVSDAIRDRDTRSLHRTMSRL